ncbi:hypothetical protein [Streptococcus halichoeri]|uniref:hypothetical protein n=1 Tax=Streptococcus halichoeri TaxID=254785 RepID=UPI00135C0976|nr:hypothetical protein [Streptococcus halichoeri]
MDTSHRLQVLRQKYLEEELEQSLRNEIDCPDSRKAKRLKKKLITLEKERCHMLIEHRDPSAITQKIALLKAAYAKNTAKKSESRSQ